MRALRYSPEMRYELHGMQRDDAGLRRYGVRVQCGVMRSEPGMQRRRVRRLQGRHRLRPDVRRVRRYDASLPGPGNDIEMRGMLDQRRLHGRAHVRG